MKDGAGRIIDYMRISITDRCNLRCKYCMPEGVECVPRWEILALEEIQAIAFSAASLGIRHIKVTGGEPLVRKDCCGLIKMLKSVPGIETVTITTNGILLEQYLEPLLEAGIDGINISLDTLDRRLYQALTGSDKLEQVLSILEKTGEIPVPVKINAVSIAEQGMDWKQMAELAARYPVDVRFIEMMPIGYGKQFQTLDHKILLAQMQQAYPGMERDDRIHGNGPAVYYRIPGFSGSVGLISAIHGKFCHTCNRVRLTAGGFLKSCLCFEDGVDLRRILRQGQEPENKEDHYRWPEDKSPWEESLKEQLTEAIGQAIGRKPDAHCFERPEEITESHNMIAIGG